MKMVNIFVSSRGKKMEQFACSKDVCIKDYAIECTKNCRIQPVNEQKGK